MANVQAGSFPLRGKVGDKVFYLRNGKYFYRANPWFGVPRVPTPAEVRRVENNNEFKGAWRAVWDNLYPTRFLNSLGCKMRRDAPFVFFKQIFPSWLAFDTISERGQRCVLVTDPHFVAQTARFSDLLNPAFTTIQGFVLSAGVPRSLPLPSLQRGYNWVDASESATFIRAEYTDLPNFSEYAPRYADSAEFGYAIWYAGNVSYDAAAGVFSPAPQPPVVADVNGEQMTAPQVYTSAGTITRGAGGQIAPLLVELDNIADSDAGYDPNNYSAGAYIIARVVRFYQRVSGADYPLATDGCVQILDAVPYAATGSNPTP